jgi:hypothetical protein
MKKKTKLILRSLAELPASTLSLAASVPVRVLDASKQALLPAVRLTRREVRAARRKSAMFARELYERSRLPFSPGTPWPHGGINE